VRMRWVRAALAPGAPVLIADERIAEGFTAPADEVDNDFWRFYRLDA
jgi:hypothetical protein